jgi:ERF superfamily protein
MSTHSEHINDIMAALAKAQGQMEAAIKDSSNPHFKSKYADLASVWEACRDPLSKNGLGVVQTLDFVGEKQVLITTLGHTSGQWIKSIIALPIQKNGPHELGSCLTYCRRYALAAMVGVYQDDDDANIAQKSYERPKKEFVQPIIEPKIEERTVIDEKDWLRLEALVDKLNDPERINRLVLAVNAGSIHEISPRHYDRVVKTLEKAIQKKEEIA